MKIHRNKMIAPIVVSIAVILYYVVYFGWLMMQLEGVWRYAMGLIPLLLAAGMVKVCVERLKEIKEGEEDDLGQY